MTRPALTRGPLPGLLVALAAGATGFLGFAPFHAWPVPIGAVGVLFLSTLRANTPMQAAARGFAFGLGWFLGGVSWVYVSLHVFGGMPAALAALATFLFCAYLALFPAAAGWLAHRLAASRTPGRRLLALAAAFALMEWVRGWLFTGFPWVNLGTSQAPGGPLAGFAPLAGAYGVTFAASGCAALLALAWESRGAVARGGAIAGVAAIAVAGVLAGQVEWTKAAGAPVKVALLQGNVPQQLKWEESMRGATLESYRRMIVEAPASVVVIPETALPAFLDQLPYEYLQALRAHGAQAGKDILLGTVEREPAPGGARYYNSLVRLTGAAPQAYRKRHLVPFGEFIPPGFAWILNVLHIPMSDFSAGREGQAPLEAGGVRFGVAICYEDIFGEEVVQFLPAAQVLVNVSNDAWFGESFAAEQHLQASQMRALESGRWMVRATNTGATAAIDERGRVASRLPQFTQGTLVQEVQPREGLTPYARTGNAPAVLAALAALAIALGRRPR